MLRAAVPMCNHLAVTFHITLLGMSLCTLHGMPVWHVYCEGREMVYFHTNGNLCGNNLLLVIIIILFWHGLLKLLQEGSSHL